MKKSSVIIPTAAAAGMLLLILDSKTALSGAREGLDLCIRTVIPSLFPFFVLSILLTGSLMAHPIPLLRPLCRLLRIPEGTESILITGFLGGYPVGAQSIGSAFRNGQLSAADARRMLAFCSNAGPAFLFGIAASLFPFGWMAWALWGIQLLSAIVTALLIPGQPGEFRPGSPSPISLPAALRAALGVMGAVCGWVVLFRVLIAFLDRWFGWLLPIQGQVILSGLLELSNGCCALPSIENPGLRFLLCSGFLSFGGLCVTMQTWSVLDGVDSGLYLPGKLLQTLLSCAMACIVQRFFPAQMRYRIPWYLPVILTAVAILPRILFKFRNRGSIPSPVGV